MSTKTLQKLFKEFATLLKINCRTNYYGNELHVCPKYQLAVPDATNKRYSVPNEFVISVICSMRNGVFEIAAAANKLNLSQK